ncbi:MAG: glutamate racemase [Gammaproteobacteria bacterium]|nr:glutamate racemase [Gammaproteobacteria bacterium]
MVIGVFDSGLGGLSVLKHLKYQLCDHSFIYVADSANAPYGNKSESFILQRCSLISEFLLENRVSLIVIACNTATAVAANNLRLNMGIPVVAIEPALKPASFKTRTGRVGVLATASTLKSSQYNKLLSDYADNIVVYEQAADGLVEQVEAGLLDDEETDRLLNQYLQPMIEKGVDSIVLGCTHYPFLLPAIKNIVGTDIEVIDTGVAVTEQVKRVLSLYAGTEKISEQSDQFFSSGDTEHTQKMIKQLLGMQVEVKALPV